MVPSLNQVGSAISDTAACAPSTMFGEIANGLKPKPLGATPEARGSSFVSIRSAPAAPRAVTTSTSQTSIAVVDHDDETDLVHEAPGPRLPPVQAPTGLRPQRMRSKSDATARSGGTKIKRVLSCLLRCLFDCLISRDIRVCIISHPVRATVHPRSAAASVFASHRTPYAPPFTHNGAVAGVLPAFCIPGCRRGAASRSTPSAEGTGKTWIDMLTMSSSGGGGVGGGGGGGGGGGDGMIRRNTSRHRQRGWSCT